VLADEFIIGIEVFHRDKNHETIKVTEIIKSMKTKVDRPIFDVIKSAVDWGIIRLIICSDGSRCLIPSPDNKPQLEILHDKYYTSKM